MNEAILNHFGRILRYFVAPTVGIATVYFLDDSGTELTELPAIAKKGQPKEPIISWWPITVFILVFGLILYSAHRTLFHWWLNVIIVWLVGSLREKSGNTDPHSSLCISFKDAWKLFLTLDRSRLQRESSPDNSQECNLQDHLNDYNASSHFLWCSAWSILLIPFILSVRSPKVPDYNWCVFGAFALIAFFSSMRATVLDFRAHEDYPKSSGKEKDQN